MLQDGQIDSGQLLGLLRKAKALSLEAACAEMFASPCKVLADIERTRLIYRTSSNEYFLLWRDTENPRVFIRMLLADELPVTRQIFRIPAQLRLDKPIGAGDVARLSSLKPGEHFLLPEGYAGTVLLPVSRTELSSMFNSADVFVLQMLIQ